MMTSVETYLRRGQRHLRRWSENGKVRICIQGVCCAGGGFFLSAGSLMNQPQPLGLGLTMSLRGWRALAAGLGALVGYRFFWGAAGWQGVVWMGLGILCSLLLTNWEALREQPLLKPALSSLIVSASGLTFQLFNRQDATLPVYLSRVVLAAASTGLFTRVLRRGDTLADWMAEGVTVLALSQVAPLPWLNFGCVAGAVLAVGSAFPAAALAGMGLDLSRVTAVPMTAVLCLSYLTRLIPVKRRWLRFAAPGAVCILVMGICGIWDSSLLPGLAVGGGLGLLMPPKVQLYHRRGETGLAQVRLELSAQILQQTKNLLLEPSAVPIDQEAILDKVRQNACGSCSCRNVCHMELTPRNLQQPLDTLCRKPGRLVPELRRGQEQLKLLRSDRTRREEYRQAIAQQYQFLADYLHTLADQLPRRGHRVHTEYRILCSARSVGKQSANGDRCVAFPGTEGKYYVLLCDGMGTGAGAAREGDSAAGMLRRMLTAGFPPEHALRSFNSILLLRGKAGAVTMDLAQIDLSTGTAALYKWGAAPSWVLKKSGAEKIGTATPPPGLSLEEARETVVRLSLRRGEVLILLSDGVEAGETLRRMELTPDAPPGEVAQTLLNDGCLEEDDASAAVIRLQRLRE